MSSVKQFLQAQRQITHSTLKQWLQQSTSQHSSLPPAFQHFTDHLITDSLRAGKFGRPTLTRLAYQLSGAKVTPDIIKASAGVELLHRFILMHDDIIDQDLLRHNGPTIEKIYRDIAQEQYPHADPHWYGRSFAIIAGDLMHSWARQIIADTQLPDPIKLNFTQAMTSCLHDTVAGWILETNLKQIPLSQTTESDILQAMQLVSAQYSVVWPLRFGQILSGASLKDWSQPLETYGIHIGLAFQIQDDILGLFGDKDTTGKPVGNDLREGKKTVLLLHAYQHAGSADKKLLETVLKTQSVKQEQVEEIQTLLTQLNSLEYAKQLATTHVQKGIAAITPLKNQPAKQRLLELAEFLVDRSS